MQINGNGQPGIRQDIADILLHQAEVKGTLAERTIQENKHYKLMTLLVSMLIVFVALGALVVTIYMAKHS